MTVRYRLFEIWRLLAALLIMFYHFAHFAPAGSLWVKDELSAFRPLLDMFFIISGFLIFDRYGDTVRGARGYLVYLCRRLARLYPLHLATMSYFVLVGLGVQAGLLRSGGEPSLYQWDTLVPSLLLVQAWGAQDALTFNFVSWSLSAEWFAYLSLPLIILARRLGGRMGLFALLLLSYAALEAMVHAGIMPFRSWVEANTWGAYRCFADFAFGAFLAALASSAPLTLRSRAPAWIAILVACLSMALELDIYLTLSLLGLAVLLAGIVERNDPGGHAYPRFLEPAAAVSFGIYLWHPVLESLLLAFFWSKFIAASSDLAFFAYAGLAMLATVLVAILSSRLFERPVSRRMLDAFGIGRGGPPEAAGAAMGAQPRAKAPRVRPWMV